MKRFAREVVRSRGLWLVAVPLPILLACSALVALAVSEPGGTRPAAATPASSETLRVTNLQVDSATASTLAWFDSSKKLLSFAGATLKNDGGGTVCTLGGSGGGNCNLALLGAGAPSYFGVFESAPPNNRTIGQSDMSQSPGQAIDMGSDWVRNVKDPASANCATCDQYVPTVHWIHNSADGLFTTTLDGTVPAPGSVSGKLLSDNGTWVPAATSGVSSMSGTLPIVVTGTTTPVVSVNTFDGSHTGVVAASSDASKCLHGDDTWGSCGTATAAIALANGSPPASVNFSTEGTVDWFIVTTSNAFTGNWLINNLLNNSHTKRGNGRLLLGGWGNVHGNAATTGTYGTTMTSTASDDSVDSAASSTGIAVWFGATANMSWNTCADAPLGVQLKLRVYMTIFGGTMTTTAHLTASGTTATDAFTIGAVQTDKLETITYTGGTAGDRLCINVQMTTNPGSGSMSLGGMTLGPT